MAAHTYISLFSGVGMLDLGLNLALPGARCVGYCEREGPAAAILASRMAEGVLDEAPIYSDVRSFPVQPYRGQVAGIIGGFPCQDLSVAGRQAGIHGDRSGLFFEIVRLVRELESVEWLFLENVPPVLAFPAGTTVLGEFAALGFDAEWTTLRASDCGAPHVRNRAFVLAYRNIDRDDGTIECEFCGYWFDADCGRYGCPNCYGEGLADSGESGPPWCEFEESFGPVEWGEALGPASELCGALFPPGPADAAAWAAILAERPDLAPAFPSFRGVAHGGSSRVDRLRALGNGVVPLQAAVAFRLLADRAGIFGGAA